MVIGDKQPHIAALLVPDPEFLAEWKAEEKSGTLKELAQDADLVRIMGEAVDRVNQNLSEPRAYS